MLSDDRPSKQMPCDICKKAFGFSKALKKHVYDVHPDDYDTLFPAQHKKPPVVTYWSDNEITKLAYYEAYNKLTSSKKVSGAALGIFLERSRSSVNHIRRKFSYKTKLDEILTNQTLNEIEEKLDFKKRDESKVCSECGRLFMNESGIIRHKAVEHNLQIDRDTPISDKYSEEEMRAMAKLDAKHRELNNSRMTHAELQKMLGSSSRRLRAINLIRNRPDYMKILQEEIDKLNVPAYISNPALELNETDFHRNKPTKCIECSMVFRNRGNFERHVRLTHCNVMVLSAVDDGFDETERTVNRKRRQLEEDETVNDSEVKRRRYSTKEAESLSNIDESNKESPEKEKVPMKKKHKSKRKEATAPENLSDIDESNKDISEKKQRKSKEKEAVPTKSLSNVDDSNKDLPDTEQIVSKKRKHKSKRKKKFRKESLSNINENNKKSPEKDRVSQKRKHKSKRKKATATENIQFNNSVEVDTENSVPSIFPYGYAVVWIKSEMT